MFNQPKTKAEAQARQYGDSLRKQKYDPCRCAYEVSYYIGRWPHRKQCERKPGHGPEALYCKQHDPEAIAKRRAESEKKDDKKWQHTRLEIAGPRFFEALCQIADGHNDARSLAKEMIKGYPRKDKTDAS